MLKISCLFHAHLIIVQCDVERNKKNCLVHINYCNLIAILSCLLCTNVGVLVWEFEGMRTSSSNDRKSSSIWNYIPRKCQSNIWISSEPISIIPKVVVSIHVLQIQVGVIPSLKNFIPQNNLLKKIYIYITEMINE